MAKNKSRFEALTQASMPDNTASTETYDNGQAKPKGFANNSLRNRLMTTENGQGNKDVNVDRTLWGLAVNEAQNRGEYENDDQLFNAAQDIYKEFGGKTSARTLTGANDLTDFLDFLGGVGDTVYGGIGNGLDWAFDNTIGNLVGAFNKEAGQSLKDQFTGEDLKWIPSLAGDLALFAFNPILGAAVGGSKALIDNRDNLRMAIGGVDPKTGEILDKDRMSAAGGAAALDTLLYTLPGLSAGRGAGRVLKEAALPGKPGAFEKAMSTIAPEGWGFDRTLGRAMSNQNAGTLARNQAAKAEKASGKVSELEKSMAEATPASAEAQAEAKAALDMANIPRLPAPGRPMPEAGVPSTYAQRAAQADLQNALAASELQSERALAQQAYDRALGNPEALPALERDLKAAQTARDQALAAEQTMARRAGYANGARPETTVLGRDFTQRFFGPRAYRQALADNFYNTGTTGTANMIESGALTQTGFAPFLSAVEKLTGKNASKFIEDARKAGQEAARKTASKKGLKDAEAIDNAVSQAAPLFEGANERIANFLLNGLSNSGKVAQGASIAGLGTADLAAQLNAQGIDFMDYLENASYGDLSALAGLGLASMFRPGFKNAYKYMGNAVAPRARLAALGGQAPLNTYEGSAPLPMTEEELAYYNALMTGQSRQQAYNAAADVSGKKGSSSSSSKDKKESTSSNKSGSTSNGNSRA